MLQLIKRLPIPISHLSVLCLALYFFLHRFSIVSGLVFLVLCLCLFGQYGWQTVRKTIPLLIVGGGVFLSQIIWQHYQELHAPQRVRTIQLLPDSLEVNGDSLSFRGRVKGQTVQAFYTLENQEEQQFFKQLDELVNIEVEAKVIAAETQRNFNGFNYQSHLRTQGIYRTIKIQKLKAVKKTFSANPLLWLSLWRRKAIVHIQRVFPAPMRQYMTGLLFGKLDSDFAEMKDIYSSLGIIHLFALSGMQVGFFIDKFRYLLLRLGFTREFVAMLQYPISFLYGGLTGFSISVVRALIQKILGNAGVQGLNNLALTVLLCLVFFPTSLLSIGGVLSFSYALLLTIFQVEDRTRGSRLFMESVGLSVGMLPMLLFYVHSFQLLAIPLTWLFSLLFDSILLPLLTVLFILSPLVAIDHLNSLFIWLEQLIEDLFSIAPPSWIGGKPTIGILLCLVIVLGLAYDFIAHRKKLFSCLVCASCLFFLVKVPVENEITMIDVGQGDSILLRDMTGKTILIDTGGRVDISPKEGWQQRQVDSNAKRTVIPYLKSRGIGRIDQLVLTHTDTDHVGDVEELAEQFSIGEILVSAGSMTQVDFVKTIRNLHTPIRVLSAGDKLAIMGSHLQVLYPWKEGDGGNNDSLVLYGRLLNQNFLFTGDLEEIGELQLIAKYPVLPVDVLKAGHHGSKGSSSDAFLDHIKPKLALLSAGVNNRYRHPHQETLERFSARGIQSLRTDKQGAIRFLGWKRWRVETVK